MLDSKSTIVLNYIIDNLGNPKNIISSDEIAENIDNMSPEDVANAMLYLSDENYIHLVKCDGAIEYVRKLKHRGKNYEEILENESKNAINNSFTIQNAYNSAIGNGSAVTNNNGFSFNDVKELVKSNSSVNASDKMELTQLIELLQTLTENDAPLKKGVLSKFSDVIKKHEGLINPLIPVILSYLTTK